MKNQLFTIAAICSLAIPLSGCGSDVTATEPPPQPSFEVLHSGELSDKNNFTLKGSLVFSRQTDYEDSLWIYSSEAATNIDFTQNRVLLVDMGPRTTTGYSIEVTSVDVHSDRNVVNVQLTVPGDGCGTNSPLNALASMDW